MVLKFAEILGIKMEMGEIKIEDSEVLKMPRGAFGPSHMYVSQMPLDIVLACKET